MTPTILQYKYPHQKKTGLDLESSFGEHPADFQPTSSWLPADSQPTPTWLPDNSQPTPSQFTANSQLTALKVDYCMDFTNLIPSRNPANLQQTPRRLQPGLNLDTSSYLDVKSYFGELFWWDHFDRPFNSQRTPSILPADSQHTPSQLSADFQTLST